jgi:hypothetical protein
MDRLGLQYTKSASLIYIVGGKKVLRSLYNALEGTDIQLRHAISVKMTLEDIFVDHINELSGVGSR